MYYRIGRRQILPQGCPPMLTNGAVGLGQGVLDGIRTSIFSPSIQMSLTMADIGQKREVVELKQKGRQQSMP